MKRRHMNGDISELRFSLNHQVGEVHSHAGPGQSDCQIQMRVCLYRPMHGGYSKNLPGRTLDDPAQLGGTTIHFCFYPMDP